jgi:hypothetical protein
MDGDDDAAFLCSGAIIQAYGQQEKENVFLTNHVQEVQSFHDIDSKYRSRKGLINGNHSDARAANGPAIHV